MATHPTDDSSAAPSQAPSGTGWSDQDVEVPLSERLQRLGSLAGPDTAEAGTPGPAGRPDLAGAGLDEDDEDPLGHLDDLTDDQDVQAQLELLAERARQASLAASASPTTGHATVTLTGAASSEVLPTSVPGLRARRGRRRAPSVRRRVSLPVLVLTLLTLVAGAVNAKVWLEVREQSSTEQARRSGLQASRDAARLLFSYDYRTLERDFAAGRKLTTGAFRTDYDKTTTRVVADVAERYKAVVKANVINAGVVSASADRVVTIVYVNQVTSSTQVKGQKVDLSRVRMTLVRPDGVWLVTRVDAL